MTREEILAAIQQSAEKHGRAPTFIEFKTEHHIYYRTIRANFGSWMRALEMCGIEPIRTCYRATMENLFRDWVEIVRKLGKIPSRNEYSLHSKYSFRPLADRFGGWNKVPAEMRAYAVRKGIEDQYGDVMDLVSRHHENLMIAETKSAPVSSRPWKGCFRAGRPVYGAPLGPSALACEPVSEGGVVFLFGMLAKELGFAVTRIQAEFPDCEALCRVEDGRWQKVRIEFEYASRNFISHMHDPGGCDLIVCWVHDWPECRLDVIELRSEMKRLLAAGSN